MATVGIKCLRWPLVYQMKMERNTTTKSAICYLCENLETWEIGMGWHCIANRQPIPNDLSDKIYDLLEEFGEDNDLPECWWLDFGDIEEWFMELENN